MTNMKTIAELLDIASDVLELNPDGIISGSLALNLQGFDTRRPPADVDIVLPYNTKFNRFPEMVYSMTEEEESYENDEYERETWKYKGVKIDVFIPVEQEFQIPDDRTELGGIGSKKHNLVRYDEILRFKILHSKGETYQRFKHMRDIIHIMNNLP